MQIRRSSYLRFLTFYSSALTLALGGIVLMGASGRRAVFDELTVQRLNVVEPDGTIRLVLADRARAPGYTVKGKEKPYGKDRAGLLFFNEDGTESGGLSLNKDAAALSFNEAEFDRTFELDRSGLKLNDVDYPREAAEQISLDGMSPERRNVEEDRLKKEKLLPRQRVFVGKRPDKSSVVVLRDAQERERLVLSVGADGQASVRFLDEEGKVTRELTP
jgi:hypothetical protein